ncbi:MAG: hypothetical protein R3F14_09805 [Polyangiaceae bacterium]
MSTPRSASWPADDVLTFWKMCRRVGYKEIRMLTTPLLTVGDLVSAEMDLGPELHPPCLSGGGRAACPSVAEQPT